MRSWSKWVSFSRSRKSCSRVGPRKPAFSELWLSGSTTPWLVVSWFSGPCVKASSCFWRLVTASPAFALREPSVREEAIDHSCFLARFGGTGKLARGGAIARAGRGSAVVQVEHRFEGVDQGGHGEDADAGGGEPDQPLGNDSCELHPLL